MFRNLKKLIDSRLGRLIVIDDLITPKGFFIKVAPRHLLAAAFFLKNDPDTRLIVLDNIIVIKSGVLAWPQASLTPGPFEILYQLKSIKLPYKLNLVLEPPMGALIPSLTPLFLAARWLEADISAHFTIEFEDSERLQ
jgi:NADH:ubiquinone oxidoreductase subunit C